MNIDKSFYDWVITDVTNQVRTLGTGLKSQFHDLFIKVIQKEGTVDLSTPEGRVNAFVAKVEPNEELGTPGGRRIQGYVRTEAEIRTNASTGRTKDTRRNRNEVIYNIFDSGSTRGIFTDLLGRITKGTKTVLENGVEVKKQHLEEIGNGLYEVVTTGEYGKCISPTYPEFYIYFSGKIARGKRLLPDRTMSEVQDRTARTRPMFIQEGEFDGLDARISREVYRMHFVTQNKPITVDDSETTDVSKTIEAAETGKGTTAELEQAAKEEAAKTA